MTGLGVLLGIGAAALAVTGATVVVANTNSNGAEQDYTFPISVNRIVDGDTFEASSDGESFKVRLILVDTPEMGDGTSVPECLALEAKEALASKIPVGTTVQAQYDADPEDNYGRKLLYIWDSSGDFVNRDLVEEGLARVMYVAPNGKYRSEIESAASSASIGGVGLNSAAIPCTQAAADKRLVEAAEAEAAAEELREAKELERLEQERIRKKKAVAKKAQLKRLKERAREREQQKREEERYSYSPNYGSGSSGGGGNSGYTGPRCYAPGGKTWTPC